MRHRSLTQRLVTRAYASQVPLPPFYRPPPSPPSAADMSSSSEPPTLIDGLPIFERKNGKLSALLRIGRPFTLAQSAFRPFSPIARIFRRLDQHASDQCIDRLGLTPLLLTVNAVLGSALRPAPVGDGPTTGFFRNVSEFPPLLLHLLRNSRGSLHAQPDALLRDYADEQALGGARKK